MKEVQVPLINDADIAKVLLVDGPLLVFCKLGRPHERLIVFCKTDKENFLAGTEESKVFLRVLVLVLDGLQVLKVLVPFGNLMLQFFISIFHDNELLVEEDVLVIRNRESERHETHDTESRDDGHLLRNGGDFVVAHEREYTASALLALSGMLTI